MEFAAGNGQQVAYLLLKVKRIAVFGQILGSRSMDRPKLCLAEPTYITPYRFTITRLTSSGDMQRSDRLRVLRAMLRGSAPRATMPYHFENAVGSCVGALNHPEYFARVTNKNWNSVARHAVSVQKILIRLILRIFRHRIYALQVEA